MIEYRIRYLFGLCVYYMMFYQCISAWEMMTASDDVIRGAVLSAIRAGWKQSKLRFIGTS